MSKKYDEYQKYLQVCSLHKHEPVPYSSFDFRGWLSSEKHQRYYGGEKLIDQAVPPPTLRPRNSAERKGEPIHSGVMSYFPDALAAVARVSLAGNEKHNPGQPLHWARGKSADQLDAAARHLLTPEAVDTESGELELAHETWRSMAELQLAEERRLAAKGIMPYSGIVPAAEPQDGKG